MIFLPSSSKAFAIIAAALSLTASMEVLATNPNTALPHHLEDDAHDVHHHQRPTTHHHQRIRGGGGSGAADPHSPPAADAGAAGVPASSTESSSSSLLLLQETTAAAFAFASESDTDASWYSETKDAIMDRLFQLNFDQHDHDHDRDHDDDIDTELVPSDEASKRHRMLEDANDVCDISVKIVDCQAFPTGSSTSVACNDLKPSVCTVDVQYKYLVTNLEPAPLSVLFPRKKKKKKTYEDEAVAITFLSEVLKPIGEDPSLCPAEDVLVEQDIVLLPGEWKVVTSTMFKGVNICDCPDVVFGAGLTATPEDSSSSSSKKKKSKKSSQTLPLTISSSSCAAADVVRQTRRTDAPSDSPSEVPSSVPSESPIDVPSSSPSASPSDVPSASPSAGPSECVTTYDTSGTTLPKQGGSTDWYLTAESASCSTTCRAVSGTCMAASDAEVNTEERFEYVLGLFNVGSICRIVGNGSINVPSVNVARSPIQGLFYNGASSPSCSSSGNRFCCCGTDCPVAESC